MRNVQGAKGTERGGCTYAKTHELPLCTAKPRTWKLQDRGLHSKASLQKKMPASKTQQNT